MMKKNRKNMCKIFPKVKMAQKYSKIVTILYQNGKELIYL